MNRNTERLKYTAAVILYGTIGMFLRYVSLPSEVTAMCRGIFGLFDKRKLPFVALAFLGVLLVSGVSGEGANLKGVIYGLLAALGFTAIVICNRKLSGINSYDKSIVQLALSAVTILPYALIHNHGVIPLPHGNSVWIVLMLGIVHTGIAYCMYFSGLKNLPVQTIAVLGYLEPVVSVLCSVLFLKEAMGITGWIGTVLVIGSALAGELIGSE